MKFNSMFHVLTFLTVSLIFSTPLMALAQSQTQTTPELSVRDQAIQDAHKDADVDVNRPMWFIIGCIFPGVGLLSPYFYKPPIPASNMIGKSPEYVTYYTDAYLQKRETLQFQAALGGQVTWCLGGCLFYALSNAALLAGAAASADF